MFKCLTSVALAGWLEVLAMESGRNVVFDQAEKKDGLESAGDSVLSVLEANGYRVLEQRFPRRAYVVIRDGDPPTSGTPDGRLARCFVGRNTASGAD